jgi:hypothetical protein
MACALLVAVGAATAGRRVLRTPGGTMEPMTALARRTGMINQRRIRGLAIAGLLCATLAGCGTAAAATAAAQGPGDPPAKAAAPEVGCASVHQATMVTVTRHQLVGEPVTASPRTVTQRKVTLVRALFGDFCSAIAHAEAFQPDYMCPVDSGLSYTGTFYDGHRALATFIYYVSGCPRISLTAAGRTRGTLLLGTAAAAAPHLKADMAAVLGEPQSQVYP